MIHLSGALGGGANRATRGPRKPRADRVPARYWGARRGCPSSDVSRPLLPESPPNGAPGTDGAFARAGAGAGSISLRPGGTSGARAGRSGVVWERATDCSGFVGLAGGASVALGVGAVLGAGAVLAAGAALGVGATLGAGAALGAGATLSAGAALGGGAALGAGAALSAGALGAGSWTRGSTI